MKIFISSGKIRETKSKKVETVLNILICLWSMKSKEVRESVI